MRATRAVVLPGAGGGLDEESSVEIGGCRFAFLVINGLHLTSSLIARNAAMLHICLLQLVKL